MEQIDLEKYKTNANTDSEGYCGGSAPAPVVRRRKVWGFWVIIVLLTGLCALLSLMLYKSERLVSLYDDETSRASSQINILKAENDSLIFACQSALESEAEFRRMIADGYAMIINNIEFDGVDEIGNVDIPAGNTLYSSDLRYLRPTIKYTGLKSGTKRFDIRFMNSDESIRKGTNSPAFYTYSSEYEIREGLGHKLVLSGWGNNTKGTSWRPGNYRLEIWCEGKCYIARSFIIR